MGILSSLSNDDEVKALLAQEWGPIDYASPRMPFEFTHYYDQEMGGGITRSFVSFERLVDPSCLAGVKLRTNALEDRFREGASRRVNLDPGLVALSRFTLATTKDNAHRVPVSDGIYVEVTLRYAHGGFHPLEWTYPDFRSPAYLSVLNGIRSRYKAQIHPS